MLCVICHNKKSVGHAAPASPAQVQPRASGWPGTARARLGPLAASPGDKGSTGHRGPRATAGGQGVWWAGGASPTQPPTIQGHHLPSEPQGPGEQGPEAPDSLSPKEAPLPCHTLRGPGSSPSCVLVSKDRGWGRHHSPPRTAAAVCMVRRGEAASPPGTHSHSQPLWEGLQGEGPEDWGGGAGRAQSRSNPGSSTGWSGPGAARGVGPQAHPSRPWRLFPSDLFERKNRKAEK